MSTMLHSLALNSYFPIFPTSCSFPQLQRGGAGSPLYSSFSGGQKDFSLNLYCLGRLEQWLSPAEQLVTVCLHFVFPTNAAASEKIPIPLPMHVANGQWETLAKFLWGLSPITRSCCQFPNKSQTSGGGRGVRGWGEEDVVSLIVVVGFYFVLRSFSLSLESLKPKAIYSRILSTTTRIACGKSSYTHKVLFRDIFSAPENEKQFNRWGKN